jgi:hypothetical protein
MQKIILLFLFCFVSATSQNNYPQDYFRNPLDVSIVLAGTFAELRSNHFHSGLDIKTQRKQGLKVYASASGNVSRIKIAHFGYGKALYITHPNGYTTVYAHLKKFSKKIEAYIKTCQYEKETYEIEIFPESDELFLEKGEVIAYSGNTGSSSGPHLHFEIRDNKERPINPMLFGINTKDTTKPVITGVYAYPINEDSHVNSSNQKQQLRLIHDKNGDYTVESIKAIGKIGFSIATTDRQDLAANKNGVYNIQTLYNGNRLFEINYKRFSFSETKHLNRLIDYNHFKKNKQRLTKLFLQTNNPLSIYNNVENNGYIQVEDSSANTYKVRIKDFMDNDVWLTIPVIGAKSDTIKPKETKITNHFIIKDQVNTFSQGIIDVTFFKSTFYDDFYLDFSVSSDTLRLHEAVVPVKKSFRISYDISQYSEKDKNKLYIAELIGYYKRPTYSSTKRKGNILTTTTKDLGLYALTTDIIKPTIKAVNFQDGKWLSKYRYLKIKIKDEGSGISAYRATINGKWILMEYDYKKGLLTYDFNDNVVLNTKNNLKIIVTDNVGNSSTFETTFFRK